eukprot:scpid105465/ scgid14817/ 
MFLCAVYYRSLQSMVQCVTQLLNMSAIHVMQAGNGIAPATSIIYSNKSKLRCTMVASMRNMLSMGGSRKGELSRQCAYMTGKYWSNISAMDFLLICLLVYCRCPAAAAVAD